jgi:hypothetical protein
VPVSKPKLALNFGLRSRCAGFEASTALSFDSNKRETHLENAMRLMVAMAIVMPMLFSATAASADERVTVGGADAALLRPAKPRASIILMSGGDGVLGIDANGDIEHGAASARPRSQPELLSFLTLRASRFSPRC